MPQEAFTAFVSDALLSLPQDLKAVLRLLDDQDLDDEARTLVAGALLHVLSGANDIPGMRGILGYVDDLLVLRLVLERLAGTAPEAMARHAAEAPELYRDLPAQLTGARAYLGDGIRVLERALDGLPKLAHEGHTATECVRDIDAGTWLYEAVQTAIVEELELREDDVLREVKGLARIVPALRSRL